MEEQQAPEVPDYEILPDEGEPHPGSLRAVAAVEKTSDPMYRSFPDVTTKEGRNQAGRAPKGKWARIHAFSIVLSGVEVQQLYNDKTEMERRMGTRLKDSEYFRMRLIQGGRSLGPKQHPQTLKDVLALEQYERKRASRKTRADHIPKKATGLTKEERQEQKSAERGDVAE